MPVRRVYPVPSDIEIAQMAELIPIVEIAAKVGLSEDDLDLYGRWKAKVHLDVLHRLKDWPNGKYVGGSSRVDLQACKLGTGRRFTTS
jgi:Formyltetrahydrofolate synthetase